MDQVTKLFKDMKDIYGIEESLKEEVKLDKFKVEIFLKKTVGKSNHISAVAKVLENDTIEIGGGAIETYEQPCEVSMDGYMKRGFVECSKSEYDEAVKAQVKWINELI